MDQVPQFESRQAQVESLVEELTRPSELREVPNFRIGSFNMYNLFGKPRDLYSQRPSAPTSKKQLDALGQMILDLDADAIGFQEVQNEKVLSDLFRSRVNLHLKREGKRPFGSFVLVPARDPRGINVALATRLAVNGTMTFHDREFGPENKRAIHFSRDLLGVELYATPTYRFLFFVAHLKSQIGGKTAEDKRRLEATEIRSILDKPTFGTQQAFIEQDMILAGDMNDVPGSPVIRILEGTGSTKLSDVLAGVHPNFSYPTHNKRRKTRLDFILTSASIRVESPLVHRTNPAAAVASDHYAVSATVSVPSR